MSQYGIRIYLSHHTAIRIDGRRRRCPSAMAEGHLLLLFWPEEVRLILTVLFATRFLISKRDDELEKVLHAASPLSITTRRSVLVTSILDIVQKFNPRLSHALFTFHKRPADLRGP